MNKICITVGVVVFGWLGWWLGDKLDMGLIMTYTLSSIGSLAGVYLGWYVNRNYLS